MNEPTTGTFRTAHATGYLRILMVLSLAATAPICAEYISAYDSSTGNPVELIGGLTIFIPLYGAPAVLIREATMRFKLSWPGTLLLASGAAIMQAGVIDQSMFSVSYRGIDYWASMIQPTWFEPFGISGYTTLAFLAGHIIWSFTVPIVLISSCSKSIGDKPWLGVPGLLVVTAAYLGGGATVLLYHLNTEADHASLGQLAGSLGVIAVLLIAAFTMGRRRHFAKSTFAVAPPWLVWIGSVIAALGFQSTPPSRLGFIGSLSIVALVAIIVLKLARSRHWNKQHAVALASGALCAACFVSFFTQPIGDVTIQQHYIHSGVFTLASVILGAIAMRRSHHGGTARRESSLNTTNSAEPTADSVG